MIAYTKSLEIRISYFFESDSKKPRRELPMEFIGHDRRISNPMKIKLPQGGEIIVDAEAMKRACEKVLEIGKI
jgi:hypothetical protein